MTALVAENRKVVILLLLFNLLLLLSLVNLRLRHISIRQNNQLPPSPGVITPKPKDGKDGVVDYTKIENYIDKKVSEIPKPADGKTPVKGLDYKDGANGSAGSNGQSAYELWLSAGNVGSLDAFFAFFKGPVGDMGPTGSSTELRFNPTTLKLECRVSGDTGWTVVTTTGVCP